MTDNHCRFSLSTANPTAFYVADVRSIISHSFLAVCRLAKAAYRILRDVVLLLLIVRDCNLLACNSTTVPPRPKATVEY